jgi:hypothetical protein
MKTKKEWKLITDTKKQNYNEKTHHNKGDRGKTLVIHKHDE